MSSGEGKTPIIFSQVDALVHWLQARFGINSALVFVFLGLFLLWRFLTSADFNTNRILAIIIATSPLWLPYILFYLFFETWMTYIRTAVRLKLGRVSLEIMIPQEVLKSPRAVENALTQLFQKASPDNLIDTYWSGKHPPIFGLELISTGGKISLIVNSTRKHRSFVENAFYSQYPGIEIHELPVDYTAAVPWDPDNWGYMPIHFGKKKPNPYPIKTYVDFGLDDDPKEEFKLDPLSVMLELLGSLKPGEHLWYQFLIRVHREEVFQTGSLRTVPDWRDEIKTEVKKILSDAKKRGQVEGEEENRGSVMLTPLEKSTLEAMERSRTKFPFNTYIRALYAAPLDIINYDRVGQAITVFQQTEDPSRNGIGYKWRADFDWNWWQDPSGHKRIHMKKEELEHYKMRIYEGRGGADKGSVLTTEELATFFHIPGSNVTTPNLARIPSLRGEAPTNLPTG